MPDVRLIRRVPKLPARPIDGHKGLFGRVLVVGGHEQMIGERCVNYTGVIEWSFFHSSGSHWDSRLIGVSGRLVSRCVR